MKISRMISPIVIFCAFCTNTSAQFAPGYEKGLATIKLEEIQKHITFLASDSLKGRASGSAEEFSAANFIASKFMQYGLKPVIETNKKRPVKPEIKNEADNEFGLEPVNEPQSELDLYMQKFNIKRSKPLKETRMTVTGKAGMTSVSRSYKFLTDFVFQNTPADDITITAPVVFAGFGIDKGENGYTDYTDALGKEIDVRNKIVMIMDGTPLDYDTASVFSKSKNVMYKNILRKAELAKKKGALAMIVVTSPLKKEPPVSFKYAHLVRSSAKNNYSLADATKGTLPIFFVNNNIAEDLLSQSGMNLRDLTAKINSTLKSVSFELNDKSVNLDVKNETENLNTQNVIGIVEGTDPVLKKEIIVIGAHYDHVGLGHYGAMDPRNENKIHNGADDNASGTTALLELAEAFAKMPAKRTFVFAAFTGEEHAMLGSRYYVNEMPVRPIENTIAMFNLDMIGRNDIRSLYVGGAFYSTDLINTLEKANEQIGFTLLYNTGLLNFGSDQAPFLRKEIPSLFYFSGFHEDYHMPSDKVSEINFPKLEKVTHLAYLTAWITGNQAGRPAYKATSIEERTRIIKESVDRNKKLDTKN